MTMTLISNLNTQEVYDMFQQIDTDCMRDGNDSISFSDTEYYTEQIMTIYDCTEEEANAVAVRLQILDISLSQDKGILVQGDANMERKFERALELTLQEMLTVDDNMCCAVYWDDMCKDNAIVMFMEYPAYGTMHKVMKDLHKRLSNKMGHPVSLCHNHPTDENVLIHGGAIDTQVYYSDECCMRSTLEYYRNWVEAGRQKASYRPELRSLFLAAETLGNGLNKRPEHILALINWDEDPQAQMIKLLVDYHC